MPPGLAQPGGPRRDRFGANFCAETLREEQLARPTNVVGQ